MKISELFKRVVGWDEYGRRTAHSLKQDQAFHDKHGLTKVVSWDEMIADIWGCENQRQLQKCRFLWAALVVEAKWPDHWIGEADKEFDAAEEAIEAMGGATADYSN